VEPLFVHVKQKLALLVGERPLTLWSSSSALPRPVQSELKTHFKCKSDWNLIFEWTQDCRSFVTMRNNLWQKLLRSQVTVFVC
jgi:hypothetical protein